MEYEPILLLISLSVQSFLISCSIENQSKNVIESKNWLSITLIKLTIALQTLRWKQSNQRKSRKRP